VDCALARLLGLSMATDELSFNGISHVGQSGTGIFKLAKGQCGWRCVRSALSAGAGAASTEKTIAIQARDIEAMEWRGGAAGRGRSLLKVRLREGGGCSRFTGFKPEDLTALTAHISTHYGIGVTEGKVVTNGWNWGNWELNHNDGEVSFEVENQVVCELPLSSLSQATVLNKNDLNIEFQKDQTCEESLHSIRFWVPHESEHTADILNAQLNQGGSLSTVGDAIARIVNISVVAPRGKHDFEFFPEAVKIHGKTQSYTVKYPDIARMFLFQDRDGYGKEALMVLGLNVPLRQGTQVHSFLVLTMGAQETQDPVINMPEDKLRQAGLPSVGMEVWTYELLAKLFKFTVQKTIVAPPSPGIFEGAPGVRCNFKTQTGYLYPLNKSMLFLTKPVVWVRYDDISHLEIDVGQMRGRTFEIQLRNKAGQPVVFSQIDKSNMDPLFQFFQKSNLSIFNAREVMQQIEIYTRRNDATIVQHEAVPRRMAASKPLLHDDDDEEDDDYVEGKSAGSKSSDDSASEGGAAAEDDASPSEDNGDEESDASNPKPVKKARK